MNRFVNLNRFVDLAAADRGPYLEPCTADYIREIKAQARGAGPEHAKQSDRLREGALAAASAAVTDESSPLHGMAMVIPHSDGREPAALFARIASFAKVPSQMQLKFAKPSRKKQRPHKKHVSAVYVDGKRFPFVNPTLPFMDTGGRGGDHHPYRHFKPGDYIMLWSISGGGGDLSMHQCVVVKSDGIYYSAGFAYSGSPSRDKSEHQTEQLPGMVITPDYYFDKALMFVADTSKHPRVKLQASAPMTPAHIATIRKYFDPITSSQCELQMEYYAFAGGLGQQKKYWDRRVKADLDTDPDPLTHPALVDIWDAATKPLEIAAIETDWALDTEGPDVATRDRDVRIYSYIEIDVDEVYCERSSTGRAVTKNCSTFASSFVKDLVSCGPLDWLGVAAHPDLCRGKVTCEGRPA